MGGVLFFKVSLDRVLKAIWTQNCVAKPSILRSYIVRNCRECGSCRPVRFEIDFLSIFGRSRVSFGTVLGSSWGSPGGLFESQKDVKTMP